MIPKAFYRVAVLLIGSAIFGLSPAAAIAAPVWYENGNLMGTTHRPVLVWQELKLESGAVGEIHCMNVMNMSVWNEGGVGAGAFEGWGTNACKAPTLETTLEEAYATLIKEGYIKSPITVFASSEMELRPEYREGETCAGRNQTKMTECEKAEERKFNNELLLNAPNGLHRRPTSFPWKVKLKTGVREEEEVAIAQIGVAPEAQTCYPMEGEVPAGWTKVPAGCVKINVIAPQIPAEVVFYGTLEPEVLNGAKNGLFPSSLKFNAEAGSLQSSRGVAPETKTSATLKMDGMKNEELIQARF